MRRTGYLFLKRSAAALMLVLCLTAAGCTANRDFAEKPSGVPEIAGLTYQGQVETEYAECFEIYEYEDGYQLITVMDGESYLLIPEGEETPGEIDEEIILLQKPLDHIYLAATSAMALFRGLNQMDHIRFSGTDASGWYIEEAAKAIDDGEMLFAGKYSEPDYELLLEEDCDIAIESTMILHSPEVKEMLESLEIPVFIDRSSYEKKALGRTEWIKVYGAMTDSLEEAEEFFRAQADLAEELAGYENTGKKVAFFYLSESGYAVVRKPSDYVADMIETAGGVYAFSGLEGDDTASSSVNLSMEEFYAGAADADYLIYNATIQEPVDTVEELLAKSEVLEDCRAVREGNVWCVGKNMYQATDITGEFIADIHRMLTDQEPEQMTFLTPVQ